MCVSNDSMYTLCLYMYLCVYACIASSPVRRQSDGEGLAPAPAGSKCIYVCMHVCMYVCADFTVSRLKRIPANILFTVLTFPFTSTEV